MIENYNWIFLRWRTCTLTKRTSFSGHLDRHKDVYKTLGKRSAFGRGSFAVVPYHFIILSFRSICGYRSHLEVDRCGLNRCNPGKCCRFLLRRIVLTFRNSYFAHVRVLPLGINEILLRYRRNGFEYVTRSDRFPIVMHVCRSICWESTSRQSYTAVK